MIVISMANLILETLSLILGNQSYLNYLGVTLDLLMGSG